MVRRLLMTVIVFIASAMLLVALFRLIQGQVVRAASNSHYVAPGGECGGMSPCYSIVQDAVETAEPGDSILIAAGIYPIAAGRNQVVYVTKNLSIQGGYTISNWVTPDPNANPTILDGTGSGRGIAIAGAGQVSLDDLHLLNGNATGLGGHIDGSDAGGGLYILDSSVYLSHSGNIQHTPVWLRW
jgi:hypothetical protein